MRRSILVIVVLLVGSSLSGAASLAAGTSTLVSLNAAETDSGNGDSGLTGDGLEVPSVSVSSDGTVIAFVSEATDLTGFSDTNGVQDVFVRNLTTGLTELVSVNAGGTAAGDVSPSGQVGGAAPRISLDGTRVAFESDATDLTGLTDSNAARDVFVRDLSTDTTTLVSVNAAGTGSGDGISNDHSLSDDGSVVAFTSTASDLVSQTDANGISTDVFVRDLTAGTTALASVNTAATASGLSTSSDPALAGDGSHVAFASAAPDLVSPATTGTEVFVRDLGGVATTLVSESISGSGGGNGTSADPAISADGSRIAFESDATDLSSVVDTNNVLDVFAWSSGTITVLSKNALGTGNGASRDPVISAGGTSVAFVSTASDLVTALVDANGATDVFVYSLLIDVLPRAVSVNAANDGTGTGTSHAPSINRDGTIVSFVSVAPDLVAPANMDQGSADVFARGPFVEETYLVSDGSTPDGLGDGDSGGTGTGAIAALSADGRTVAFPSYGADFGVTDTNNAADVYAGTVFDGEVSIGDVTMAEGDAGTTDFVFSVTLSDPNPVVVQMHYEVDDGTATTADGDYVDESGTITFNPGEELRTVPIAVNGDLTGEPNETFTVVLSQLTVGSFADDTGLGTITDDDGPPPPTASTLTVSRAGAGEGGVRSTPAGIQCPDNCSHTYPAGTPVSLEAVARPGSMFDGWGGDCAHAGTAATCALTMDADKSVTATFQPVPGGPHTLTVVRTGKGPVRSRPRGISCGLDCTQDYLAGTMVTLTAHPQTGWTFSGWGGDCASAGSSPSCSLTMDSDKNVTATFAPVSAAARGRR